MSSISHQLSTGLPNFIEINKAIVKISSFENERSKIKVSTQPIGGHTLSLTLASVEVSHSDSNVYKTWRLQMKIKYL